eukprot:1592299-Rhodomonas_salina.1
MNRDDHHESDRDRHLIRQHTVRFPVHTPNSGCDGIPAGASGFKEATPGQWSMLMLGARFASNLIMLIESTFSPRRCEL